MHTHKMKYHVSQLIGPWESNYNHKYNFKYDFMCNIKNIAAVDMILTKSCSLFNWEQFFYINVKQLQTMQIHSVRSL